MTYLHRTLDVHDDSDHVRELLRGWLEAAYRGFHEDRVSDRTEALWLHHAREDTQRPRGFWLSEDRFGAGALPVATYSSWTGELNTGARMVPLHMISDVTVSPAHRRQGLLRRMIEADLAEAAAAGLAVAALTVSEGGIYGRFGFGPASWRCPTEVDTRQFRLLDVPTAPGRMEMVDPRESGDLFEEVFDRWHAAGRGSVSRPAFYRPLLTGWWFWDEQSPDDKLRGAVHLDADERPDGYVLWRHSGWEHPRTVRVRDLVAATPQVGLELWRFLSGIDLTERVTATTGPDDPLRWALADPQACRVTDVKDHLWVRLLDLPAALHARPWYADGEVVLDVADDLGHVAGRWRLTVADGRAHVAPAESGDPGGDLRLDASVLGSLYLGGVDVGTLAAAGRITGPGAGVDALARMSDGGAVPFSVTSF